MKLKLDLHPIYSDSRQIEAALQDIIEQACEKRAAEVEIIPGKGSGSLKKSVLRFLDRPEIKSRYHRLEKDSDNWGRLFIHFRWERNLSQSEMQAPEPMAAVICFCCSGGFSIACDGTEGAAQVVSVRIADCPACGSPNRITLRANRRGEYAATAESGY